MYAVEMDAYLVELGVYLRAKCTSHTRQSQAKAGSMKKLEAAAMAPKMNTQKPNATRPLKMVVEDEGDSGLGGEHNVFAVLET